VGDGNLRRLDLQLGGRLDYTDRIEQRQTNSLGRCIGREGNANVTRNVKRRGSYRCDPSCAKKYRLPQVVRRTPASARPTFTPKEERKAWKIITNAAIKPWYRTGKENLSLTKETTLPSPPLHVPLLRPQTPKSGQHTVDLLVRLISINVLSSHEAVIAGLLLAWQPLSWRFMLLRTLKAFPQPA